MNTNDLASHVAAQTSATKATAEHMVGAVFSAINDTDNTLARDEPGPGAMARVRLHRHGLPLTVPHRDALVAISFTCGMCGHARSTLGHWGPKHLRNLPRISSSMLGMPDIAQSAYLPSLAPVPPEANPTRAALRSKGTSRMGAIRTSNRGPEHLVDLT